MARNQEKAQSMLYRFRESQAAELGISLGRSKDQRRPRLASSCKDLRECEKWRGDVLREISRKVSKIQDFGLTDYEIRDINDEINKLLREKNHWENQIISLGGANYKRGIRSMVDDAGREIPGTRGYKYFGRAKDLPGVKELLSSSSSHAQAQEQESFKAEKYRRFVNQPPEYWGDEDEDDGVLLAEEEEREREMWQDGLDRVAQALGMEISPSELPTELPRRKARNLREVMASASLSSSSIPYDHLQATTTEPESLTEDGKRKMSITIDEGTTSTEDDQGDTGDSSKRSRPPQEDLYAEMLPALDTAQLVPPKVPNREETEKFILRERKRMLREEYVGT